MMIDGAPESTSQLSMFSPKNGASSDRPPIKYKALAGVRYLGCNLANQPGSMPVRAIEYTSLDAPNSSEFQDVKIPAIPPAIRILAISWELNNVPKASATAISVVANSSTPMADDVVATTMMYQAVAIATEMITGRPTLRAGTFTSSADWGMTSKPINKNGMAINTVKKPAVPGVNKGSIFETAPRVVEPKIISTPTASRKMTVKFWAMDACLTPRTFNQVMIIAPMTPINAHVRCTVCPATSHNGIALISGKIYATVRGNATASKATMVT